jgi:hypothetical protein
MINIKSINNKIYRTQSVWKDMEVRSGCPSIGITAPAFAGAT